MQFHAYAESFPLLTGPAYEEFKADIAATGGPIEPVRYRMNGHGKEGLDGRNRIRACAELKIDCPMLLVEIGDEDVEAFIDSLNLHRRHLNSEQQQEKRQKRIKEIVDKRKEGKSLRTIADEVGVSESTVRNDIETATAQGCAVEPPDGKVKGKDGKEKPATMPKNLCKACQHRKEVGKPLIENCEDCKAIRKPKKDKPKAEPEAIVDSLKLPIPKDLEEVFSHAAEFRSMMRDIGAIRTAADKLGKTSAGGWIDHQDLDRVLKQAQMHLRFAMPYTECPKCRRKKDKKCTACKGTNWINETTYGAASSDDDKQWLKDRA